jgi:hypothetical protein
MEIFSNETYEKYETLIQNILKLEDEVKDLKLSLEYHKAAAKDYDEIICLVSKSYVKLDDKFEDFDFRWQENTKKYKFERDFYFYKMNKYCKENTDLKSYIYNIKKTCKCCI